MEKTNISQGRLLEMSIGSDRAVLFSRRSVSAAAAIACALCGRSASAGEMADAVEGMAEDVALYISAGSTCGYANHEAADALATRLKAVDPAAFARGVQRGNLLAKGVEAEQGKAKMCAAAKSVRDQAEKRLIAAANSRSVAGSSATPLSAASTGGQFMEADKDTQTTWLATAANRLKGGAPAMARALLAMQISQCLEEMLTARRKGEKQAVARMRATSLGELTALCATGIEAPRR